MGDLLKPPMWGDPETPYRILYDSTFFFVVIVILLNIIFGIIIDTFGGTRPFPPRTNLFLLLILILIDYNLITCLADAQPRRVA